MTDPVLMCVSACVGAAVSLVFHLGLWFTVRRIPMSPHPARLTAVSLFVRLAVVVGAFVLIARSGSWQAVFAALLAFTAVRFVVARYVKSGGAAAETPGMSRPAGATREVDPSRDASATPFTGLKRSARSTQPANPTRYAERGRDGADV